MATPSHTRQAEEVLDEQDSSQEGLVPAEVERRLAEHGYNEVAQTGGRSTLAIFVAQFNNVLIWVLLAAALLSAVAGHGIDAALISVIVVVNGIFGFVQDYRAEQSLEALREMTSPTATVRRDGSTAEIDARELVPGDVIELESGDVIPADGRLLEDTDLEVDEAALTGESAPVSKSPDPVEPDTPLAERKCMVYSGTNVTRGRGVAVVTETGMETQVGSIAQELSSTEETRTPLQEELDVLGRRLGLGVAALAALVVPLLLLRETPLVEAGLTAVSLGVAAIPEGLPAVVTLTLALGVRTMAEENALVRRLPAVEALGSVDVICTDKTGTLTEGRMSVSRVWVNDAVVALDDEQPPSDRTERLLRAAALCNDATADDGDPTERALVAAAEAHGIDVEALRTERPRTDEVPFSSERKWMGTVHDDVGYVKGAPGVVLSMADRVLTEDGPVPLTDSHRSTIEKQVGTFADDALRVLAVATTEHTESLEDGLVFIGLVGMIDPAREEVAEALAATERAGIDVKMITGDNVRTAAAIAGSLGMGQEVLEGRDLDQMDDEELREQVEGVDVFARTSPEHKVRILKALKPNGHTVAMTGDGVNDAPALKNADVGVAMGVRGTDVAKHASDMILLDDNYATIERAVERGRAIFDNLWKFVAFLLSANVAEVAIVFIASLWGISFSPRSNSCGSTSSPTACRPWHWGRIHGAVT